MLIFWLIVVGHSHDHGHDQHSHAAKEFSIAPPLPSDLGRGMYGHEDSNSDQHAMLLSTLRCVDAVPQRRLLPSR